MRHLNEVIRTLIHLRTSGQAQITLLAVCPNSSTVLEAAVKTAAHYRVPMLFAATLNQVDRDGGYTGWTPAQFVDEMRVFARKYTCDAPLYPCLDHGGPWLKDIHTSQGLSLDQTISEVKQSLSACLEAGYQLLHIDTTVDRTLPPDQSPTIGMVVERTVELIAYTESERQRLDLPPVAYEVGSDEVHGGLVDFKRFKAFLHVLKSRLAGNFGYVWPCFIVTQVGTDLHTTRFDTKIARRLYQVVSPLGSLIKGHYTDWVENPAAYPATGMGAANIGPEFTAEEFLALRDLEEKEIALCNAQPDLEPSCLIQALRSAVISSGRWRKWLLPDERTRDFDALTSARQEWLLQTGARYIWTDSMVVAARRKLYVNLSTTFDPHEYVVDRISRVIEKYLVSFGLLDNLALLK